MRQRSVFGLLVLLLVAALLFGCTQRPPASDASGVDASTSQDDTSLPVDDLGRDVVARINGSPIYADALAKAKNTITDQYAQTYAQFGIDISTMLAGADGRLFELAIEAEAFLQLTQQFLTQQEADRRGIVIDEAKIDAELSRQYSEFLAQQDWTEADLAMVLADQGKSVESFKADVRSYIADQLLAMAVQRAVAGPFDITDEQLASYFDENRENYGVVERIRASHILVETQAEAEEIERALADGADFSELATAKSTDTVSAARGGDLGWFARGVMVPEFEDAAFALEVGEMSPIVESSYGFHIIRLTDRQEAAPPELADVSAQVRTDLENELSYDGAVAWYDTTFRAADFKYANPLLEAAVRKTDDLDGAIETLERARAEGTVDDPYLPYVLGTLYGLKVTNAQATQTAGADSSALSAEIATYREAALALYREALDTVGSDAGIESKIAELSATSDETP
jgi:parvulin-like peptidyl-prolyl isomerase